MNESILNGILIFGVIQAIFFSLLFFTKKRNAIPDRIISFWLLILAINIFSNFTLVQLYNEMGKPARQNL